MNELQLSSNHPLPPRAPRRIRASELQSASKRQRRREKTELPSNYARRPVKLKARAPTRKAYNRRDATAMHAESQSKQHVRSSGRQLEDYPFRGFFLVAQPHWARIDEYLSKHGLSYEYFHASFINACHRFVRALQNSGYKRKDCQVQIRDILREHPVPASKYIEALEIFRREFNPPAGEIVGRPIKSTNGKLTRIFSLNAS